MMLWKIYLSNTAAFRYPFGRFQGWVLGVCVVSNASRNWGTYLQPSKNPENKQLWPQNHPFANQKKPFDPNLHMIVFQPFILQGDSWGLQNLSPGPWQKPGGNRRRWIIVWRVIWDPVLARLHGVMSQPCFGVYPFVGSWYLANGGGGREKKTPAKVDDRHHGYISYKWSDGALSP